MRHKATIVQGGQLGEGEDVTRTLQTSFGRQRPGFKLAATDAFGCPDLPDRCTTAVGGWPWRRSWVLAPADRLWLQLDQRLPAWDTSRLPQQRRCHGRAWGCCLPEAGRAGMPCWISPRKIFPPLASLVNGTVNGRRRRQALIKASWALALWQALLLLVWDCLGTPVAGRRIRLARRQRSPLSAPPWRR